MDLLPPVTHVVAFLLGVATWLPFTLWEGRRVAHLQEGDDVPLPRRVPPLAVAALVVSALLVGFGIQQYLYQQDATQRDECYQEWGQDLVDTVDTRTAASSRVSAAQEARDDALDNIVLFIIAQRQQDPPPAQEATERGFSRVLGRFATAKSDLETAQDKAEATRARNPYPTLDCAG